MLTPFGLAALYLAGRGIPVFPLHTPVGDGCSCGDLSCGRNTGKHPRLRDGLSGATADRGIVAGWWEKWPEANVAAVAGPESGFHVTDVDAATPGEAWLARMEALHGPLPPTRRARTGGGGVHYFWRYDASLAQWLDEQGLDLPSRNGEVRDEQGEKLKGVDVKAARGYVVVAPSRHRLGGVYEWLDERPTAHAPEWLLRAVCRPRATRREPAPAPAPASGDSNERKWGLAVLRNACAYIAGTTEGGHDIIRARSRLVGGAVGAGYLTRDEAEAALIDAGVASGRKPKEVQRTVRWGLTKGESDPIQKPPSRWEQAQADREAWKEAPREAPATLPAAEEERTVIPDPPPRGEEPPPFDEFDTGEAPKWPHCTDVGNAEQLVNLHGKDLRWCDSIPGDGWLVWDGTRWAPDKLRAAMRRASEVGEWWRDRAREIPDPKAAEAVYKWAGQSEGIQRIRGMMELTKGHPTVVVQADKLDADRYLFNTPNLTLDLRDARAYPPRREDLITRVAGAPAVAGSECPTWLAFLDQIMAGDQEVIDFLQRAIGYSMTGDVSERCLFILYGTGANGKSTFVEAVRNIMGDYARNTPIETFTTRREGGIPNDIAALAGARFVTAGESQEGMGLNEALVKLLTGDDAVSARFLNREFFDFKPQFKAWIPLNHKPQVRGTDNGIWDRLRLIPFNVTIAKEQRDRSLGEKLRAEAPGILKWALDGCGAWRADGLSPPASVLLATDAYRAEMDVISGFLEECCELGASKGPTLFRDIYKAYVEWAKDNGMHPRAAKWVAQQLDTKKIRLCPRHGDGIRREGIALLVKQTSFPTERWSGEPSRD